MAGWDAGWSISNATGATPHRAENRSIKHATGNGGAEALGETPAPKRVHLQLRTAAMHNGWVAFSRETQGVHAGVTIVV